MFLSRRLWADALLVLSVVLLFLVLAAYLARFLIVGAPDLVLGFVASSPWVMLIGAPLALIFAVAIRQWYVVPIAVVLTVLGLVTQLPLFVATTAPKDGVEVTVMTSNLRLGEASASDVVSAVRAHDVALLMVQEMTAPMEQQLENAGLDQLLPFKSAQSGGGASGTGLWSKYPIVDSSFPTGFSFVLVEAQVAIPGVQLANVVALHMTGPVPASAGWEKDIRKLPSFLQSLPADAPTIVAGDFNATYDTKAFRNLLVGGFADGADQAGAGIVRTYPSNATVPPLIGIDHVLTRGGPVVTKINTVKISGTDHRAVVAKLSLPHNANS